MAKYIVIICLAFLIPAVLVDRSETIAIESVPTPAPAVDAAPESESGCKCGDDCPCVQDAGKAPVEIEEPKSPSDVKQQASGLLEVGSRRILNGIEQELTRVERVGNRVRYYYRPVGPVVRSGGLVRSHWTYPGTIDNHLTQDHGVSVNGMSREEMLSLHDSLHESGRPVLRSQPVTSNCPGGVCPPQSRRLFRW